MNGKCSRPMPFPRVSRFTRVVLPAFGLFIVSVHAFAESKGNEPAGPWPSYKVYFKSSISAHPECRQAGKTEIREKVLVLRNQGQPDMILPLESVLTVVPLLPPAGVDPGLQDLLKGYQAMQESRGRYACAENSDAVMEQWSQLVVEKKRMLQEQSQQLSAEQERLVQESVRLALQKEDETKQRSQQNLEEEESRKLESLRAKFREFQGLSDRKIILETIRNYESLPERDRKTIPMSREALEYWKKSLGLPAEVALPRCIPMDAFPELTLQPDSLSVRSFCFLLVWAPFFLLFVAWLFGVTQVLVYFHEQTHLFTKREMENKTEILLNLGTVTWPAVILVTSCLLWLLYFSPALQTIPAQALALDHPVHGMILRMANVPLREYTVFEETREVSLRDLRLGLLQRMQTGPQGGQHLIPELVVAETPPDQMRVQIPIRSFGLSLRVCFLFLVDSSKGEPLLLVQGASVGLIPIGATLGQSLWDKLVPAYQGMTKALGMADGVRVLSCQSGRISLLIPEVRSTRSFSGN